MSEEADEPARDDLSSLLYDFCGGYNVALSLYSATGTPLLTIPRRPAQGFCRKVRGWLYGPEQCSAQARRMRHLAADRGEPLVYTCHAGLRCCAFPVCRSGRTLAVATIGDFRYSEEPSPILMNDWLREVGPATRLIEDFRAVPRLSAEGERQMVRLFKVVAEHAVSSGLIAAGRSPLFERIVEYVHEHVAQPAIMIDEVATHVSKSASTVSHLVKREAGISFKRLVIEQKLAAADELMAADSRPTIGEVAEHVGYSDQFYFSRIYKKYRGFPPRDFSKRCVG
jgi:AraC-like DNA-binding protein